MNNIEQNALRIAELIGYKKAVEGSYYTNGDGVYYFPDSIIIKFSSYNGLMDIVLECNYVQDDLDIEIVIYGSGLDVHLDDEDIMITTFDTKEGFIKALQLACIKYLELKNEN